MSEEDATPHRVPKPAFWRRRWLQMAAAGLVGLVVGLSAGRVDGAKKAADTEKRAQRQIANITELRDRAVIDAASAHRDANSYSDAAAKKAADESLANDNLNKRKAVLDEREAALAQREQAVQAAQTVQAAPPVQQAGTFGGDGVYLVGVDVQPGTYRAAASSGCYYARLRSTSTSDIIDNNITDGPVVLTIKPTDKALQVNGCGQFQRV